MKGWVTNSFLQGKTIESYLWTKGYKIAKGILTRVHILDKIVQNLKIVIFEDCEIKYNFESSQPCRLNQYKTSGNQNIENLSYQKSTTKNSY